MMATALSGSRFQAKAPLRPSWWLLTVAQQLQEATIAPCAMAGLTFCNNPGCSNPSWFLHDCCLKQSGRSKGTVQSGRGMSSELGMSKFICSCSGGVGLGRCCNACLVCLGSLSAERACFTFEVTVCVHSCSMRIRQPAGARGAMCMLSVSQFSCLLPYVRCVIMSFVSHFLGDYHMCAMC